MVDKDLVQMVKQGLDAMDLEENQTAAPMNIEERALEAIIDNLPYDLLMYLRTLLDIPALQLPPSDDMATGLYEGNFTSKDIKKLDQAVSHLIQFHKEIVVYLQKAGYDYSLDGLDGIKKSWIEYERGKVAQEHGGLVYSEYKFPQEVPEELAQFLGKEHPIYSPTNYLFAILEHNREVIITSRNRLGKE